MDEKLKALIAAVEEWAGDRIPRDPSDAELMKALWHYSGDNVEPCEGCDGECGEVCAPITVGQACAELDEWSANWRKRRGMVQCLGNPGEHS